MAEPDATIEQQLERFSTPRIEKAESQTGTEDKPIRILPNEIIRVDTEAMDLAEMGKIKKKEGAYDNILKYGKIGIGPAIALTGLGIVVRNRITANSANILYDEIEEEEEYEISPNRLEEHELSQEEDELVSQLAKMIQVVYDRKKKGLPNQGQIGSKMRTGLQDVPEQNEFENYRFQQIGNDITGLFVNDKDKKVILALRGIEAADPTDRKQLFQMGISTILENERADSFGIQFKEDKMMVNEVYKTIKKLYPDYELIITGHSRGGGLATHLGRKYREKFHSFSSATNLAGRNDVLDFEGGNHYYHVRDPVPVFLRSQAGKSIEQHHTLNNRIINPLDAHSINNFVDRGSLLNVKSVIKKSPKLTIDEVDEMQKSIIADIRSGEVITGEDFVDSDLGNFPDTFSKSKTKGGMGEIPLISTFNDDVISDKIFYEVNKRPTSKFNPNVAMFNRVDTNKDGFLSKSEFKSLYPELTDEEITRLFFKLDKNNDGFISMEEFVY